MVTVSESLMEPVFVILITSTFFCAFDMYIA
jgi:hypothetical protein